MWHVILSKAKIAKIMNIRFITLVRASAQLGFSEEGIGTVK